MCVRPLVVALALASTALLSTSASASWSFGASNPTSVGSSGLGSGRVAGWNLKENVKREAATPAPTAAKPMPAGTAETQSPREAGTGRPSGQRMHTPISAVSAQ